MVLQPTGRDIDEVRTKLQAITNGDCVVEKSRLQSTRRQTSAIRRGLVNHFLSGRGQSDFEYDSK